MVVAALIGTDRVGLDVETTGLDHRGDRVRLLSLSTDTIDGGVFAYLLDLFDLPAEALGPLWDALAGKELVGHNVIFDVCFLERLGFTPSGKVHCTQNLSRVLYAGSGFQVKHTLAACAQRELGEILDKEEQRSDWSGTLTASQLAYAARDVLVLPRLLEALNRKITEAKLERTAEVESRCLPALAWMSCRGVAVSREAWAALVVKAQTDAARLRQDMLAIAPVPPGEMFVAWNFDSPAQVKRLFQALGVSLASTDDSTLAGIDHPMAELLRQYREAMKKTGTYGEQWLKNIAPDGRVYASWNQTGSEAGRMSCSTPNMQHIPREAAYRRCVAAPPGRVLVKADYSQIELRIAAKVTQDPAMLEAYRTSEDLHTRTARQVLGLQEVTKKDRQLAKAINFGLLYGMGAKGFRGYAKSNYGLDLHEEQAESYRAAFFRAYKGLEAWHRRVKLSRTAETRTLAGRRRLIPSADPSKPEDERRRFEAAMHRERLNTPVQGTGADGLKLALALLWERRAEMPGTFPVLAVHDEIVLECDQVEANAVSAWLRKAMLDAMTPLISPVPVEVDVKVARTWGGD
jgi:DNA polymerase-1